MSGKAMRIDFCRFEVVFDSDISGALIPINAAAMAMQSLKPTERSNGATTKR